MKIIIDLFKKRVDKINPKKTDETPDYLNSFEIINQMSDILNQKNLLIDNEKLTLRNILKKPLILGCSSIKDNKFYFKTSLSKEEATKYFPLESLRLLKLSRENSFEYFNVPCIEDSEIVDLFKIYSKDRHFKHGYLYTTHIELDERKFIEYFKNNIDERKELVSRLNSFIKKSKMHLDDHKIQIMLGKHNSTLQAIHSILKEVRETNFSLDTENINGINEIMFDFINIVLERIKEIEIAINETKMKEKEDEDLKIKLLQEKVELKNITQQRKIEEALSFERKFQKKHLL
jgi:hypothetical protein